MNSFLENIKEVCELILPILGVIALVFVIILLDNLIKTIKNANVALTKGVGTIDQVNSSIEKVQAPLDTAVKIASTVDKAHDATIKGLTEAKDYVAKNGKVIKDKVVEIICKDEKEALSEGLIDNENDDIGGSF